MQAENFGRGFRFVKTLSSFNYTDFKRHFSDRILVDPEVIVL